MTDPRHPSGTEPLNTVQPELGSPEGWDRPDLAALLRLQPDADGMLRSAHVHPNINGAIFGGQLIGQALAAAAEGIAADRPAHSLQLNFLAPGLLDQPMRYRVTPLLDGRSFQARHVLGVQGERTVISANVSFHRPEFGPRFQHPMPEAVPPPEAVEPMADFIVRHRERLAPKVARRMLGARTAEIRPLEPETFLFHRVPEGHLRFWIRARQALPDEAVLHQAAMAYLSDFWFPVTAMAPNIADKLQTGLYTVSLNHVIWFHHPLRMDDWLFVDAGTPFTGDGRGLSLAQVYDRRGMLVATWAQEGLQRGWVDVDGRATAPGDAGPPPS